MQLWAGWDGAQDCSAGNVVEIANLIADNERLRGLLREALEWMDGPFSDPALAAFFNRVDAALAGAADRDGAAT